MQSLKQRALGALRKNDELANDADDEISYQRRLAAEEEAEENTSVAFENLGKILNKHHKKHGSFSDNMDDSGSESASRLSGAESSLFGEENSAEHRSMGSESNHEIEQNIFAHLRADSHNDADGNGRDHSGKSIEYSEQESEDEIEAIEILSSEEEEPDDDDDEIDESVYGEEEEEEQEEEEEEEQEEEDEMDDERVQVRTQQSSHDFASYGNGEREYKERDIEDSHNGSNEDDEDLNQKMIDDSLHSRHAHDYQDYTSLQTESFHPSNEVYMEYYDDTHGLHMSNVDADIQQLYHEDDNVESSKRIQDETPAISVENNIDNVLNDAATLLPIFNILDEQSHLEPAIVQENDVATEVLEEGEITNKVVQDNGNVVEPVIKDDSELHSEPKAESSTQMEPTSDSKFESEKAAENKAEYDTEMVLYKPLFEAFPYVDISQYMPKPSAASISALQEVSPFEQSDASKLNNYRTMAQLASARLKDNNINFGFGSFTSGLQTANVPEDHIDDSQGADTEMEEAVVFDKETTQIKAEVSPQPTEVPVVELKTEEVSRLASSAFSALLKSDIFQGLRDKVEIPEIESEAETEPCYVEEYSSVIGDSPAASVYDGKEADVISLVSETVLEGVLAKPFEVEFDYQGDVEEQRPDTIPARKRARKSSVSVNNVENDEVGEKKRARHAPTKSQDQSSADPSTPSRRTRSQQQENVVEDHKVEASPIRKSARTRRSKVVEPEPAPLVDAGLTDPKTEVTEHHSESDKEKVESSDMVDPEEGADNSSDNENDQNDTEETDAAEEKAPRRSTRAHESISDEQIKEAIEQSNSGRKTRSKKATSSTAARSKTAKVGKTTASPRKSRRTNVNKK